MARLSSRVVWGALGTFAAGGCYTFAQDGLAVSPRAWAGNLMIAAYALLAVAAVFGYCCASGVRFPVLGEYSAQPDLSAEPEFPLLPDAPTDRRSDMRQALDLYQPEDLREALDAASGRPSLYHQCAACGFPLSPPRTAPDCNGGGACLKRLQTPVNQRLRLSGPRSTLAVHPQWAREHQDQDYPGKVNS